MATFSDEFNAALLGSVDQAISSLLSQEVAEAFRSNLRDKRGISPDEIPDNLPTVSIVLRKYFGPSSETIENVIVRELYAKYGLEFQENQNHQLTDYVENARQKLGAAAPTPEPKNVSLPLKADMDRLLVDSVKEAIEDVLGKKRAELAFRFLEHDVTFDQLPRHLPTFYMALKKNFGKDSGAVETAIAKKLYTKLSLEFTESPNTELSRYVEGAYIKLNQREQQGFINISGMTQGR